jgi:hypothetical protein
MGIARDRGFAMMMASRDDLRAGGRKCGGRVGVCKGTFASGRDVGGVAPDYYKPFYDCSHDTELLRSSASQLVLEYHQDIIKT